LNLFQNASHAATTSPVTRRSIAVNRLSLRSLGSRLALTLLALLPIAVTAAPVAPFSATYEVRRNGEVLGEARLELARDGNAWRFTTATRGTQGLARLAGVSIDEASRFRYRNGRPETLDYRFRQRTSFNTRERSADVDAAGGTIQLKNRDQQVSAPYVAGVVDRQLVTIALMQAVAAGRRGAQAFSVAGRDAVEAQSWTIGALEAVPGDAARTKGWRVERQRESADGRSTQLWLAADGGHLPLRMLQREDDGESIEMRLLSRQ
jgi:hypothetical protein